MTGTPPKEHLKKVDDDQCMKQIDELDDTRMNQQGRHFFRSQELVPVLQHGYYSTSQSRYILGASSWRDNMTPNSSWTTTSAAALVLTCPAGHRYRVYYAGCRNATQASLVVLSGNIGGNAWTDFNQICGEAVATTTLVAIGGSVAIYDGVGVSGKNAIPEVWLNAADTLTMTLSVYAAGNNTEHLFLFEDYTL